MVQSWRLLHRATIHRQSLVHLRLPAYLESALGHVQRIKVRVALPVFMLVKVSFYYEAIFQNINLRFSKVMEATPRQWWKSFSA